MPSIAVRPFIGGVIESGPTPEYTFAAARSRMADLAVRTDSYEISEYTPISDQGGIGTCGSNALCDGLEILLGLEDRSKGKSPTQISRLFHAWCSRSVRGNQYKDSGIYLFDGVKQMQNIGVCAEEMWPYVETNLLRSPPLETFGEASDNKITGAFRIDAEDGQRVDDVEMSVRADHPVAFATDLGEEYVQYQPTTSGVFLPPTVIKGRHAQLITGVRHIGNGRRHFKIRNSWSNQWGIDGHAWIDETYLTWARTDDLWVLTRMTELIT